MNKRDTWRPVLEAEVRRWEAKAFNQLASDLAEHPVYEVEVGGKAFQVEVYLLENAEDHLHVSISVDDGSLPASLRPLGASFIRQKPSTS